MSEEKDLKIKEFEEFFEEIKELCKKTISIEKKEGSSLFCVLPKENAQNVREIISCLGRIGGHMVCVYAANYDDITFLTKEELNEIKEEIKQHLLTNGN